jgi:hypothetical protein
MSQGRSLSFTGWPKGAVGRGAPEKRFKSGEQWEVLRREEGAVIVGKNGGEKQLPLDQTGKFSVFGARKDHADCRRPDPIHEKRQTPRSKIPK